MSKLKQGNNEDYPEAAGKHLEDAIHLFVGGRYTGSAYLTGYIFECILKTFLQLENQPLNLLRGHNLNGLSHKAAGLCSSSSKTAKYYKTLQIYKLRYDPKPRNGWSENIRYFDENCITEKVADEWLTNAENFYNESIRQMKLDGLV